MTKIYKYSFICWTFVWYHNLISIYLIFEVLIVKATQMVREKYSQIILKYQEKSLSKLFEENGIDKDWSSKIAKSFD